MSAPDETSYLKTDFLLRIAHELRGPAGVIRGSLTELSAALGEDVEPYQRFFAMADRGVARVLRTASLLEQTGQLAAGTVDLHLTRCDLRDLTRSAVARAESIEARRRIGISMEMPEDKVMHDVDPEWMTIALGEIGSNAIRHATHRIRVQLLDSFPDETRVIFIDDGATFTPFEPVRFRPPPTMRGHGLALSIAKDVLAAHGGRLTIERTGEDPHGETRVGAVLPHGDRTRGARVS